MKSVTSEIPADASGADLQRLAVERPDLRPAIARHPALYPDLRDWLARLGDPAVDAVLAAPVNASPATSRPPRRIGRLIGIVAAGIVAAVALVIGGIAISNIPRYPETQPVQREQLREVVIAMTGDEQPRDMSRAARAESAHVIAETQPSGCGIIRSFGISMFAADEIRTSEDYDIRAAGGVLGSRWTNARLFPTPEAATAFFEEVRAALPGCASYVDGGGVAFTLTPADVSPSAVKIEFTSFDGTYVVTARHNVVFAFSFGGPVDSDRISDVVDVVAEALP